MKPSSGIGERIRIKREECKWTQKELACRMGYTHRATINKIETNINDVSASNIIKFAKVLGTSVEYLMGIEKTDNVYTVELTGDDLQDIINLPTI